MKIPLSFLMVFALTACSVLPYENKVSCRLGDNYGKCMSIQQAYEGNHKANKSANLVPGKRVKPPKGGNPPEPQASEQQDTSARDLYVQSLYKELSALIQKPITPVIKAPKEIRTLVLTYAGPNDRKTLFMPRYIYTIVEDAEFVVDQYFSIPERDAQIFGPWGAQ